MQKSELSLIGKIDNGFTKILRIVLNWLSHEALLFTGMMTFIFLSVFIFEHGNGLGDLSPLEWGFIPVLALLLWRHVCYCKHFRTGFWRGLGRLTTAQGVLVALHLITISLMLGSVAITTQSEGVAQRPLLPISLVPQLPAFAVWLFVSFLVAIYLAAPTEPRAGKIDAEPVATAPSSDTPTPHSAKEANL